MEKTLVNLEVDTAKLNFQQHAHNHMTTLELYSNAKLKKSGRRNAVNVDDVFVLDLSWVVSVWKKNIVWKNMCTLIRLIQIDSMWSGYLNVWTMYMCFVCMFASIQG